MIDKKWLHERTDEIRRNVQQRGVTVDVDALLRLDEERLALLQQVESMRRERNEIAEAMKSATPDERPGLIERGKLIKEQLGDQEDRLKALEAAFDVEWLKVPNMTHPESPVGATDADNVEVHRSHNPDEVKPAFTPKSHVELAEKLDLIDFERGAKVAGAKFYFLKNRLAVLEQALLMWVTRELAAEGFIPLSTPDLAKDEVIVGTGFSPRGPETQIYSLEGQDLSLVGTAEITIGGMHKDEIFTEDALPRKYIGVSHCFRTEAGTYGRESYGLYRVHQFSKAEMFVFCTKEQSDAIHAELLRLEQRIFDKLGLVYRVIDICTGDLGGPAYRKYDLEAWMYGRGEGTGDWGEVTSTSNCTDYQARRLNVRVRRADGTLEFAHTLNGTAVATSRALIAIMEQCQQEDGSIHIPEVLQPLCGFKQIPA